MYRKNEKGWLKHLDFIFIDLLCLHLAFVLAYGIRQGMWNPYTNQNYLNIIIVLSFIDLLVAILFDTFKNALKRGRYREFVATVRHVVIVELCISFYMFAVRIGGNYSRMVIVLTGVLYLVLGYGTRCLWKKHLCRLMERAERSKLLIITSSDRLEGVKEDFHKNNYGFYSIIAAVIDKDMTGTMVQDMEVVADRETVVDYVCREWVDEVLVILPAEMGLPEDMINAFRQMGVVVHIAVLQAGDAISERQIVERIGKFTVITSSLNYMTTMQAALKRLLDITGGLVGTLMSLVICVIFGPIIYVKSPGPILFKQTRVGRNGKKFQIYKLRTMYMDAEERKKELMEQNRMKDGLMFKLDFDPRIIGNRRLPDGTIKTGIGQFLRRTSLDEFPQFINILKGDMSLVGTRPPTVDEWERYELHHRARLAIRPGLTGMWQVSGRSNITDFEEVVKLDTRYINEWSMGLDLRILVKTVKAVLKNDGAM